MEKLIVKNFGPIKEAEIDLTKYVVFIGDTSTGKSVLAKLISIFRDSDLRIDSETTFKELLFHYNIDFNIEEAKISYSNNKLSIVLANNKIQVYVEGKLSEIKLETFIKNLSQADDYTLLNLFRKKIKDLNFEGADKEEFKKMLKHFKYYEIKEPIYIPAERILTSLIGNSISGLWANNVALPICFKDFAAKYEVARKNIKNKSYSIFGFTYSFENGNEEIIFQQTKLMLSKTSSGIQSLIPLLLVFDYELESEGNNGLDKTILIEEPELNLYPIKQKILIEHILQRINKTDHKIIITTHSPYILSSLDTLMLAKNTFNEHPDLKEEITAIVSEDKWIDYNDISVYEVRNDGKVYSIKNEEFRSIDTNAIDGVSDIISEEFDKLTELRYAH
jgi:predicted ATP-dependent endonuclease of OLD family